VKLAAFRVHNAFIPDNEPMKRYWLLFSQVVTVLLAMLFVLSTLKPQWVNTSRSLAGQVTLLEAPAADARHRAAGSLSEPARIASPAVVSINTRQNNKSPHKGDPWFRFFNGDPDEQDVSGLGSGVIVSPQGFILTNSHVVENADGIEVVLHDGRKTQAKVIGLDPDTDLALLKIDLDQLPVIVLGNPDSLRVGDVVLAIGNPFGVGQTVTSGIVSALGRNHLGINTFENFIQTDAAINPGNSGGALVDVQGHLMGINSAIYSRSGGSMGIGFAIPVSTAKTVMDSLLKDGKVTRGWLGVEPTELTLESAQAFGLSMPNGESALPTGVMIAGVLQNGPAAKAGVQPGDVVVEIAAKPVRNVAELLSQVAALQPGVASPVKILRGKKTLSLTISPGVRPMNKQR
jgi:Do/DeqQ family serine protease